MYQVDNIQQLRKLRQSLFDAGIHVRIVVDAHVDNWVKSGWITVAFTESEIDRRALLVRVRGDNV
jgi:hypothetical protein